MPTQGFKPVSTYAPNWCAPWRELEFKHKQSFRAGRCAPAKTSLLFPVVVHHFPQHCSHQAFKDYSQCHHKQQDCTLLGSRALPTPKAAHPSAPLLSAAGTEKLRNHLISYHGSRECWRHSSSPDVWVQGRAQHSTNLVLQSFL